MLNLLAVCALHLSYWVCGLLCLKGYDSYKGSDILPSERFRIPEGIAAYFIGLVPNCVTMFTLNQFLGIQITLFSLFSCALIWLTLCFLYGDKEFPKIDLFESPLEPWGPLQIVLCTFVLFIIADKHSIREAFYDWDTLMYHIPFGEMVRNGHFPQDIGRSYILEVESAYPPLLYFQYGINLFIDKPTWTYVVPQITVLVVNAMTCVMVYFFARIRLGTNRNYALMASGIMALIVNPSPNFYSTVSLYLLLALYYSWDLFRPPSKEKGGGNPYLSMLPVAFLWSGIYWMNYVGLPVIGLFFIGLGVVFVLEHFMKVPRTISVSCTFVLGASILLLILPHLSRNMVVTGNPLYPGLLQWIGGFDITEWYLKEAPHGSLPMVKDWRYLPVSFWATTPIGYFLVVSCAASLLCLHLPWQKRIALCFMTGGYFLVWFELLHLNSTSFHRYLNVTAPLSCAVLGACATAFSGCRDRGYVLVGSLPVLCIGGLFFTTRNSPPVIYVVLITLSLLISLGGMLRGLKKNVTFSHLSKLHASPESEDGNGEWVGVVIVAFCVISTTYALVDLSTLTFMLLGIVAVVVLVLNRTSTTGTVVSPGAGFLFAFVLGSLIFLNQTDWEAFRKVIDPLEKDIEWLNKHVPRENNVLLFDGRIASLETGYLPVDSIRAEPMHLASSVNDALKVLQKLNVSHFYFSYDSSYLLPKSLQTNDHFLFPSDENPYVKLVHISSSGWIVELMYDTSM